MSDLRKELCRMVNIKKISTIQYQLQTDRIVKEFNEELVRRLLLYVQINGIGTNISTQYYSHTELQLIYQEGNIRTFYFTVEKHFYFQILLYRISTMYLFLSKIRNSISSENEKRHKKW